MDRQQKKMMSELKFCGIIYLALALFFYLLFALRDAIQGVRTLLCCVGIALAVLLVRDLIKLVWRIIKFVFQKIQLKLLRMKAEKKQRLRFSDCLKRLSDFQKISFYTSAASVLLLLVAWGRWDGEFYILLRWIVCLAFLVNLRERFSPGFKFTLILGAIIYNPIAQIHLGHRDDWIVPNLVALILILRSQIVVFRRIRKELKESGGNGAA